MKCSRLPINKFLHWVKFDFFSAVICESGSPCIEYFVDVVCFVFKVDFEGMGGSVDQQTLAYPLRPTLPVIYFKNDSKCDLIPCWPLSHLIGSGDQQTVSYFTRWWMKWNEKAPSRNGLDVLGQRNSKQSKKKFRNWIFFFMNLSLWAFVFQLYFFPSFQEPYWSECY